MNVLEHITEMLLLTENIKARCNTAETLRNARSGTKGGRAYSFTPSGAAAVPGGVQWAVCGRRSINKTKPRSRKASGRFVRF